jgi:RimJ/RimL family protein N-acetyltransferase
VGSYKNSRKFAGAGLPPGRIRGKREVVLTFAPMTEADLAVVQQLAHRIWHAHYPEIISVDQIDYMLGRFFALEVLRRDLDVEPDQEPDVEADAENRTRRKRWTRWEVARWNDEPVGFFSCVLDPVVGHLLLSKLYLLPAWHGRGLGQEMLARVAALARQHETREIRLTVNRHNAKAIRAYERAGFRKLREVVAEIGHGFVMDDYEMGLSLTRTAVP